MINSTRRPGISQVAGASRRQIDDYIFGEPGFWYVKVEDFEAGYFHSLKSARRYLKTVRTKLKD